METSGGYLSNRVNLLSSINELEDLLVGWASEEFSGLHITFRQLARCNDEPFRRPMLYPKRVAPSIAHQQSGIRASMETKCGRLSRNILRVILISCQEVHMGSQQHGPTG